MSSPSSGVPAPRRNFVNGVLARFDGSLDEETLANVALLTSELASNAMMHSRSDFDVTVKLADGHVRVEVKDPNPACHSPAWSPSTPPAGDGSTSSTSSPAPGAWNAWSAARQSGSR